MGTKDVPKDRKLQIAQEMLVGLREDRYRAELRQDPHHEEHLAQLDEQIKRVEAELKKVG